MMTTKTAVGVGAVVRVTMMGQPAASVTEVV